MVCVRVILVLLSSYCFVSESSTVPSTGNSCGTYEANTTKEVLVANINSGKLSFVLFFKPGVAGLFHLQTAFEEAAAYLKERTDIFIGTIDIEYNRSISKEYAISSNVELRYFLPGFPSIAMNGQELVLGKVSGNLSFVVAENMRKIAQSLNGSLPLFEPHLNRVSQQNLKTTVQDMIETVEAWVESNSGDQMVTDIIQRSSLYLSQMNRLIQIGEAALTTEIIKSRDDIENKRCGQSAMCIASYVKSMIQLEILNAVRGKKLKMREFCDKELQRKKQKYQKTLEKYGLPSAENIESITTEREMRNMYKLVNQLKCDCDSRLENMEIQIIETMKEEFGSHQLRTKQRLRSVQNEIDNGADAADIKGEIFRKFARQYAQCTFTKNVLNELHRSFDSLQANLAKEASSTPGYAQPRVVPSM